jgi:hypothetical protein
MLRADVVSAANQRIKRRAREPNAVRIPVQSGRKIVRESAPLSVPNPPEKTQRGRVVVESAPPLVKTLPVRHNVPHPSGPSEGFGGPAFFTGPTVISPVDISSPAAVGKNTF